MTVSNGIHYTMEPNEFEANFYRTIRKLKKKIINYRKLGIDEANTKSGLIQPELEALGWDITDFRQVELERQTLSKNWVDIALKVQDKPVIYIEAKRICESLSDGRIIGQACSYGLTDGVDFVIITNGDKWDLYLPRSSGSLEAKLVFEIQISTNTNIEFLKLFARGNVKRKNFSEDLNSFIVVSKAINVLRNDEFMTFLKFQMVDTVLKFSEKNAISIDREGIEMLLGTFEIEKILADLRDQIVESHSVFWYVLDEKKNTLGERFPIDEIFDREDIDYDDPDFNSFIETLTKCEEIYKTKIYYKKNKDANYRSNKEGYIFFNEDGVEFVKLIIKPEDELVLKNQILSLYAKEDDRSFGKWVAKNWRWETIQYFLNIGLEQTVRKAYEAAVDDAGLTEQAS